MGEVWGKGARKGLQGEWLDGCLLFGPEGAEGGLLLCNEMQCGFTIQYVNWFIF